MGGRCGRHAVLGWGASEGCWLQRKNGMLCCTLHARAHAHTETLLHASSLAGKDVNARKKRREDGAIDVEASSAGGSPSPEPSAVRMSCRRCTEETKCMSHDSCRAFKAIL